MDKSDTPKRGRGRPPGAISVMAKEAREQAKLTGELPHEFLLRVARGEVITTKKLDAETGEITEVPVMPDLDRRIDAAKAAAPYFAPKISTVEVMAGVTDDQLDQLISQLAQEAGISLAAIGEAEEEEGTSTTRASTRRRIKVTATTVH